MNKRIIKNMFNEKINKDKIHEKVMIRVESKRKVSLSNIIKLSVVPICAIIVMVVSLNIKPVDTPNKTNKTNVNAIVINNIDDINQSTLALDIMLVGDLQHPSYDSLLLELPWISNIKIPYGYKTHILKQTYEYEGVEYKDYYVNYNNEDSSISIYFSKISEYRPRCIRIIPGDLEDSTINGLNVKLFKYSNDYNNGYYALFKFNGLNFDIETRNITEEEFINLIESIISSTKIN